MNNIIGHSRKSKKYKAIRKVEELVNMADTYLGDLVMDGVVSNKLKARTYLLFFYI
jgi:hypothetical protein